MAVAFDAGLMGSAAFSKSAVLPWSVFLYRPAMPAMKGPPEVVPVSPAVREAAVAESQEARLAMLYRQHAPAVFRMALRLCGGNVHWAEDITHDVFLKVWGNLPNLADLERIGPWLRTVTYRLCLDQLKRERGIWGRVSQRLTLLAKDDNTRSPHPQISARQDLTRLSQQLADLPARQAVIFAMKFFEDMSQNDIAAALGLSAGQVSKLLTKTIEALRTSGWELADE